jgi:hypothetical protein
MLTVSGRRERHLTVVCRSLGEAELVKTEMIVAGYKHVRIMDTRRF